MVIVCRSDQPISEGLKRKISMLCDVPMEGVASAVDADNIYEIPLVLPRRGDWTTTCAGSCTSTDPSTRVDLSAWEAMVDRIEAATTSVRIGLIGKYVNLPDAYLSGGRGPAPRRVPSPGQGGGRVGGRPRR